MLAQYHFTQPGRFQALRGCRYQLTRFSNVDLDVPGVSIKKNSLGPALQMGFDYALDKNWSINFDVKKVYIKTNVLCSRYQSRYFQGSIPCWWAWAWATASKIALPAKTPSKNATCKGGVFYSCLR